MRAYLLIQTEPGRAESVTREIRSHPGVASAEAVTGSWDVIVEVEAGDRGLDELGTFVVNDIQKVEGITRTLTCPVVKIHGQ